MDSRSLRALQDSAQSGSLAAIQRLAEKVVRKRVAYIHVHETLVQAARSGSQGVDMASLDTFNFPAIVACLSAFSVALCDWDLMGEYFSADDHRGPELWDVILQSCEFLITRGQLLDNPECRNPSPELAVAIEGVLCAALSPPTYFRMELMANYIRSGVEVHNTRLIAFARSIGRLWCRYSVSDDLHQPDRFAYALSRVLVSFEIHEPRIPIIENAFDAEGFDNTAIAFTKSCVAMLSQPEFSYENAFGISILVTFPASWTGHLDSLHSQRTVSCLIVILRRMTSHRGISHAKAQVDQRPIYLEQYTNSCKALLRILCYYSRMGCEWWEYALDAGILQVILATDRISDAGDLSMGDPADIFVSLIDYLIWPYIRSAALHQIRSIRHNGSHKHIVAGTSLDRGWRLLEAKALGFNDHKEFKKACLSRCGNLVSCPSKSGGVIPDQHSKPLKKCGGCEHWAYCSRQCQRVHWDSGHKDYCTAHVHHREASLYLGPVGPQGRRDISEFLHYMAWRDLRTHAYAVKDILDKHPFKSEHFGKLPVLALDYRRYVSDGAVTVGVLSWADILEWRSPELENYGSHWWRWVEQVRSVAEHEAESPAVLILAPYMDGEGPIVPKTLVPYTQLTPPNWLQRIQVSKPY